MSDSGILKPLKLFADVHFELFDIAQRTRKQPDSWDNVIFVIVPCFPWSFCELKAVVHEKAVESGAG